MGTADSQWFVENFHLHSPVEEFEQFARIEAERLRAEHPGVDDSIHREAAELVLRKLRPIRREDRLASAAGNARPQVRDVDPHPDDRRATRPGAGQ